MGLTWSDFKSWNALAKEKEESVTELLKIIKTKKMKRPNVLVIGLPGAGKSALISSIVASMTHNPNIEASESGKLSGGGSHTLRLHKCNDAFYAMDDAVKDSLPIFFDMPGISNYDDELQNAILSCVLDGKVPQDEVILKKFTREEEVMEMFNNEDTKRYIDRVIFVHSAAVAIPENLTKAVSRMCRERAITVFGVLTHKDMVSKAKTTSQLEYLQEELGTTGTLRSGALQLYHRGMLKYASIPENFKTNCYIYMLLLGIINQNYQIRSTS